MDYSTIDLDALRKLPTYRLPPSYHLQDSPGNGCFGDHPPGYPTYFTRSVYTRSGNNPGRGPQMVIEHEGTLYVVQHHDDWKRGKDWDGVREIWDRRLRKLWRPLPLGHERVRLWVEDAYRHHAHCYVDDARPAGDSDRTVIWPVPSYKLEHFHDDPRFSDEWRAREQARVADANREIALYAKKVCVPENHAAYRRVHRFYPEHVPDLDLIAHPPDRHGGQWWETEAERPTPETCSPRAPASWGARHPMNESWCQWCGWRGEKEGA